MPHMQRIGEQRSNKKGTFSTAAHSPRPPPCNGWREATSLMWIPPVARRLCSCSLFTQQLSWVCSSRGVAPAKKNVSMYFVRYVLRTPYSVPCPQKVRRWSACSVLVLVLRTCTGGPFLPSPTKSSTTAWGSTEQYVLIGINTAFVCLGGGNALLGDRHQTLERGKREKAWLAWLAWLACPELRPAQRKTTGKSDTVTPSGRYYVSVPARVHVHWDGSPVGEKLCTQYCVRSKWQFSGSESYVLRRIQSRPSITQLTGLS